MLSQFIENRVLTLSEQGRVITSENGSNRTVQVVESNGGNVQFRAVSSQPESYRIIRGESGSRHIHHEDTQYRVTRESIQGPPGQKGADGIGSVHEIHVGPISTGATGEIDSLVLSDYRSCKWVITVIDDAAKLYRMSEVNAVHNDAQPSHTHYGMVGDAIQYGVEVTISGSEMRLRVSNRHANSIHVSALRLPTNLNP